MKINRFLLLCWILSASSAHAAYANHFYLKGRIEKIENKTVLLRVNQGLIRVPLQDITEPETPELGDKATASFQGDPFSSPVITKLRR